MIKDAEDAGGAGILIAIIVFQLQAQLKAIKLLFPLLLFPNSPSRTCVLENTFRFLDSLLYTDYSESLQLGHCTSAALNIPFCWLAFSTTQE